MKLKEIVNVASQVGGPGFDINQFELVQSEPVATAENNPVFQLKHSNGSTDAFAIKKDNAYVSVIIGHLTTFDGKPAFVITRTFTHLRYRNQGLITSLYLALKNKLNLTLISDKEMSPETRSVWKKLSSAMPILVVDASTNKILGNWKEIPDNEIFNIEPTAKGRDGVQFTNIRLMTEGAPFPNPQRKHDTINDIAFQFRNSFVVPDNQIYTHLEVIGKYL